MWSGFSSEIETQEGGRDNVFLIPVACGAASHLRLKRNKGRRLRRVLQGRMWSGFSSEIETRAALPYAWANSKSHVERLLI